MGLTVYGGGGKPEEEKTVTAGTSVKVVTPSEGKTIKKVTINPTPSQSKTVTPSTSQQTVSPDSGKLLSQVIVKAMEDVTPEVTAQTPIITQIAENLGVSITTPSGTNKQILQGNNANLQLISGYKPPFKIVTWAGGTDEEIVKMVQLADQGLINLSDYWAVGDTRTVQLSAMSATGVGESHAAQKVDLVLMHKGGYKLADGSICNFVVGQKDSLNENGYMNSTNKNIGSWDGSARRAWCNNEYKNAMPESLSPIFKQFKTITAETYNGTTLKTSLDFFALPAEREVFGAGYGYAGKGCANNTEAACEDIFQFEYYQTASNRIKKLGISGSASYWWERSPYYNNSTGFCSVSNNGNATYDYARSTNGLAPFGCI